MKTPIKFSDIPTPDTDAYKEGTIHKGRTLFEHAQHLERQLARETEFGEAMAGEVVAIENALGFKSDDIPESDKHGLVMDRIRDLVAAEGELGDLREGVSPKPRSAALDDLLNTVDAFGHLMPSFLLTPASEEGKAAGLVEDFISSDGPWQRLTVAGMNIRFGKEDA